MNNDPLSDVCSVEEFARRYPHLKFTKNQFKTLLRHKKNNGLEASGALVKVGCHFYVKTAEFSAWYYRHINIYGRDN